MAINLEEMKTRLEAKRRELRESLGELTEAQPEPIDPIQASEGTEDAEEAAVDINEMEDERAIRANQREAAARSRGGTGTYQAGYLWNLHQLWQAHR